jgi:capsular exopolysaccharide synthesis family protein
MMPSLDETSGQTVEGSSEDPSTRLTSQVEILKTDAVAWDTIRKLRLDQRVSFTGKRLLSAPNDDIDHVDPVRRMKLLDKFQDRLKVKLLPKTEIIELRFRDEDPVLAAQIVNTMADDYIGVSLRHKFSTTMQASDWLATQLNDLKQSVEQAEQKYASYQKEKGIILTNGGGLGSPNRGDNPASSGSNIVLDKLEELNHALSTAESDRILKEARFRTAQTHDPELITNTGSNLAGPYATLAALRSHEVELKDNLAKESAYYGPAYPSVVQLRKQVSEVEGSITLEIQRVAQNAENDYDEALRTEQMLTAALDQQKQVAYRLNEDAIRLGVLQRDAEASRDTYEEVLKKLKIAGVLAGLKATNLTIVDPATVPGKPEEPKSALMIAIALFGGLVVGIGMSFAVEALDSTIRTPEDVEGLCFLPSLGIIPLVPTSLVGRMMPSKQDAPIMISQPNSQAAEAFRCLRTALLLATPSAPPKILVVTSGLPKEGKTTTSVNMAIVMAQKGARVLLVDADLRRPSVLQRLGLKNLATGLSTALAGGNPANCIISIDGLPFLNVMPAGLRPPNPAELLDSIRMRELLSIWCREYDHIVIDCAPVLGMTDSVVLATMADAVVLVVRSSKTRYQSLRRTRDLLASVNARVAGVVVNGIDTNSESHYAYYGYYGKSYDSYYLSSKAGGKKAI